MDDPLIAKEGRLVVETDQGLSPATRNDLDGANLVSSRGALFVETPQGLRAATVHDARSAIGRIARQLVKDSVTPFSDPDRASQAGTAAAKKLTSEQRSARAKKAWETRRKRLAAGPR